MENINKINAIVAEINAVNANENLTLEEKEARMKELMAELDSVAANACAEVGIDYNEVKENALKDNPEAREIVNKLAKDVCDKHMPRIQKAAEEALAAAKSLQRKPKLGERIAQGVVERVNTFRKSTTLDKVAVVFPIVAGCAYLLMRRKADQKALAAVGASYLAREGTEWVIKGFEYLEALNDQARKELAKMQAAAKA